MLLGVCLLAQPAWPVTINFFAYYLYEDDCTNFLGDGVTVLLIASTANNSFGALTTGGAPADSFTGEPDDVIVGRVTFDSQTIGLPGAFASAAAFTLGENGVAAGNPLLLVWYAGLQENTAPTAPGPGRAYGVFRDSSWVVPGDNSATITLVMATPAAGADLGDIPNATELEGCARFVTLGQANLPPVAQCISPIIRSAASNCTASVTAAEVDNGSSDPDSDPITLALDPVGPYPVGTNAVALIVADNQGNANLCVTSIIVRDTTPPVVTCGADLIVQAASGATNAVALFDPPTATDNCGIATLVAVPASGSTFPLGTNTVIWTATDTSGNANACQFRVIVREVTVENASPTAICRNLTRAAGTNCQAIITAADINNGSFDPDGDPITLSLNPAGPFALGVTNVTLIVADNRGGTNTCVATVTVVDTTPPTLTCPAPVVAAAPAGVTNLVVVYGTPAASDACGSVTVSSVPGSGGLFPVGTNTVTVTAVDAAGNTNTCAFTVTVVRGNAAPTIQCRNLVVPAATGCVATATAAEVDNGTIDPDGDPFTLWLDPAGPFPIGTNSVSLVGADDRGNTNTCAAVVVVADQAPPILTGCPESFAVNAAFGATSAVVNYTPPTAVDDCSGATVTCVPPPGSTLPLGTNTVVCTAVDAAGNSAVCEFTVLVRGGGTVARDLAVTRVQAGKRVRLSASKSSATARVVVTIQNRGAAVENIESLAGLVTLVAESLQPELCPNLTGALATVKQAKVPVALKPKKKLKVAFDVTYSVSCIPDLRQTTKRENFDDYRYVATVDRTVLDDDADSDSANDTLVGPVTDVVVWFW